jgi:hypothetical protein
MVAIVPLTNATLTTGTIGGDGTFDVLMAGMKVHLAQEYSQGRITGQDYSSVYLGALTAVMGQSVAYLLAKDKITVELELLELQKQKLVLEKDLIIAQTRKTHLEADKIPTEIDVLIATKCKLQAEFDVLVEQKLKVAGETSLVNQKKVSEAAQTQSSGVDEDSVEDGSVEPGMPNRHATSHMQRCRAIE